MNIFNIRTRLFEVSAAILVTMLLAASALAHDYMIGNLEIIHPYARATMPGAPVSGGYMLIRNTGSEPDRLVAGSAGFAGKVEIHEMMMDGDVMKMREIEGGLEIPAGGEVVLKPGGFHVMFMQLSEQLMEGEARTATLTFEKAGTIEVDFNVEVVTPGSMKHEDMDHSGHTNQ